MVWCVLVVSLLFWLFKSNKWKLHIWPTYSNPNQSYVRYNLLQWFQHCKFRMDYLSSLQASIYQYARLQAIMMEWMHWNQWLEIIAFGIMMEVYSRYIYLAYHDARISSWNMSGIYLIYAWHTILYGFQMSAKWKVQVWLWNRLKKSFCRLYYTGTLKSGCLRVSVPTYEDLNLN